MKTFSTIQFIAFSLTLLFVAGCSRDGLVKIEGRVTYDGQPIERGTINFFPADGVGPSAAVMIAGGAYHVRLTPGEKRVHIEAFRVVGQHHGVPNDPKSPMLDELEQTLPAKYNRKTELSLDVKSGVHTHDFVLEK